MTKKSKIGLFIALLLTCTAVIFISSKLSYGHLHIRVVDAYTLEPLSGATIVIADTNKSSISDKTGSCIFTGVPIQANSLHQHLVSQSWGECTILAEYEGYRPTVILHAQVEKNQMRNGPTVYMFPTETDDIEVAVIAESPKDEWINQLVEKYLG